MPLLQKSIQLLGKPLPKVITPKAHAIADYGIAALFLIGAVLFWNKNRGAAKAGLAATTDSPGAFQPRISFASRKKIDLGLSTMAASMPTFLAFEDERERSFFRMQSVAMAGVAVLTDFGSADSKRADSRR